MMGLMQIDFHITDEEMVKLTNGALSVSACITNAADGRVVRRPIAIYHRRPIASYQKAVDATSRFVSKRVEFYKQHTPLVNSGMVAIGVGALGLICVVAHKCSVKKATQKEFDLAFSNYLSAINNKTLNTKVIEDLCAAVDQLLKNPKIKITISADQLNGFINALSRYTMRLAEANNAPTELTDKLSAKHDGTIVDFRRLLKLQKQIVKAVA